MYSVLKQRFFLAVLLAGLAPVVVFAQETAQPAPAPTPVPAPAAAPAPASGGPSLQGANPLGVGMTRQHADTFEPGKPFMVTVTMGAAKAGQITAMGLHETLPPDWRLESVAGGSGAPPDVAPAPGATGVLEFGWITVPQFPYAFSYVVTPPDGDGGAKEIDGALEYRQLSGAHHVPPTITRMHGPNPKPPTITLKGGNPVTLNVGDTWQEPGYTALDSKNVDITGKVVVNGTVDTSRAGEYGLGYTVSTDDGQKAVAMRAVVVKENGDKQTAPAAGGTGAAPPREPGPSGRELSNPIAASAGKNPVNKAQPAAAPTAAATEGEAAAAIKKPDLPDTAAFRPPPTPKPGDKPAPQPGNAAAPPPPTAPAPPAASVPATQHRAPVPPEMLKSATAKETAPNGAEAAETAAIPPPASVPKSLLAIIPEVSMQTVGGVAAVLFVLLGGLGLLGWRLVYSRPIRRKRPPTPPSPPTR